MTTGKKILIIEDDSLLQEFYKILFRKLDIDFMIMENGDEIIDEIIKDTVCLIIMDINLRNTYLGTEKIDGIKLSRYIKEKFYTFKIPILLVTAYSQHTCGDDILQESRADDIILKPIISYDKLLEKVRRLAKSI